MLTEEYNAPDLSGELAGDRRAGGKRHQSVLLVGKVCGEVESACVVHDISRHGLMARFPVPPEVGKTLVIEVRGMPQMAGVVRWVKGRKAGLQFAEAQPIEQVFRLRGNDGLVARPPRFPLYARAAMAIEGKRFRAETLDISAGGVKLAADRAMQPGQTGQVTLIDTDVALFGKVCWTQEGQFGFRFIAPLPLETLAQILAR